VVGSHLGVLAGVDGPLSVDKGLRSTPSLVGALAEGIDLLRTIAASVDPNPALEPEKGVILSEGKATGFSQAFARAMAQHRFWDRVPA
jgi:hypothetical protein